MWTMFFWGMEDELLSQLFCFSCLLLLTTPLLNFCFCFCFVFAFFASCLLLLTTPLPAFCICFLICFVLCLLFICFLFAPVDNSPARFLARFLYKLYLRAVNGGRRKKRYLAISIYIYLDHSRPFWLFWQKYRFCAPMIMLMLMMMGMTMFVHQCLPMIIPLCLLASQSYAAIQPWRWWQRKTIFLIRMINTDNDNTDE